MKKNTAGAPPKYGERLDDRITVLVSHTFKEKYFKIIPEHNASEHIFSLLMKDYDELSKE